MARQSLRKGMFIFEDVLRVSHMKISPLIANRWVNKCIFKSYLHCKHNSRGKIFFKSLKRHFNVNMNRRIWNIFYAFGEANKENKLFLRNSRETFFFLSNKFSVFLEDVSSGDSISLHLKSFSRFFGLVFRPKT